MKEITVEKYLTKKVKEAGGICVKLGVYKGIPDRMLLLPKGKVYFVELKREDGILSSHQLKWQKTLRGLKQISVVIRYKEEVDVLMEASTW